MAAEIIEQEALDPQEPNSIPDDMQAMSTDELIEDFSGGDTTDVQQTVTEEDVPDKYRGKSIKEVVSMHQEAEKLIGSQGGEVGELRKIVDSYITGQIQHTSQEAAPEVEEVDFFEDPQKAVSQAISTHPDVVASQQAAQNLQRQTASQQMTGKHPDAQAVLQDPAFANWVKGSPIRTELFVRADQKYDFSAADELLSNWKERTQVTQQAQQQEQVQRKQEVARASTGSGRGANTSGAKRMYRRADIIKLMKNDPDRYEALSTEIMQAYAEGRVR